MVELEPPGYAEVASPVTAAACPWALGYSPDSLSLAATIPFRPDPRAALFGHLWIVGPQPLDRDMGRPCPRWRIGRAGASWPSRRRRGSRCSRPPRDIPLWSRFPASTASSLGYTTDGARLLVGTRAGWQVLDAGAGYALLSEDTAGAVTDIAVARPAGGSRSCAAAR